MWAPTVHGQSCTYVNAIVRAGGAPILLPLSDDHDVWQSYYELCDGILFAGGNDVDPALYGATPNGTKLDDVSRRRDDQELALLRQALNADKPVLAICRGMQLLNVSQGGNLYQDIVSEVPGASDHEDSTHQQNMLHLAHTITLEPQAKLAQILQVGTIRTNSHHHQGVKDLGSGLIISARSEDGMTEGIEMPQQTFVIAVQSHPESLEMSVEADWQKLFRAFVAQCQLFSRR